MEPTTEAITVLISEEGEVYPLMTIFETQDEVDDHIFEAIQTHLKKVGRLLGVGYFNNDEIPVIVNADNSVRPFVELAKESIKEEAHLMDAIRAAAKMEGFRVGTAYIPVSESCGCDECQCGGE